MADTTHDRPALELGQFALDSRTGNRVAGHMLERSAIRALMDEVERLTAELEGWIDPARLEALTIHPPISIIPMQGVSMAGDRWIVTGGHGGRGVNYARTFPEALAIAEAHR